MGVTVQYLGWASFLFTDSHGNALLTDPFLVGDEVKKIPKSPFDAKDIVADLIVVSHPARDHFQQGPQILANSPKTRCLGDHSTLIYIESFGFKDRGELTTAGAVYEMGDFKITAYDARHVAFARLPDKSLITGEPLVYIIEVSNGPTFFFGGDTSVTYDMKLWADLHHPDYAIIGIGGVQFPGGRTLDEMNPVSGAKCAELMGVKHVIPMHYWKDDSVDLLKENIARLNLDCDVIPMQYGEVLHLT